MQVPIPSILAADGSPIENIVLAAGDIRFIGSDDVSVNLTFETRGFATFVDVTDAQATDEGGQIVLMDQDDPAEFQSQVLVFPFGRLSAADIAVISSVVSQVLDPTERITGIGLTDNNVTALAAGVIEIGHPQTITVTHEGIGLAGGGDGAAGFGISSTPFPPETNGGVVRTSVVEADIFSSTDVRITATNPEIVYEDILLQPGKYYLGVFSGGNASAQDHNLTIERSRFNAADVDVISSVVNRELGPTKRITGIGFTDSGAGSISGRNAGVIEIGYPQSITVTHQGIGLAGTNDGFAGFGISSTPYPAGENGGVVGGDVVASDIFSSTDNRITATEPEIVYEDIQVEPGKYYLGVFSGGGASAQDHTLTIGKSRLNAADVSIISATSTGGTGSGHTAEDVASLILADPTTPIANDASGFVTTSNPATGGTGSNHTAEDVAELILANPANLLATDASGSVTTSNPSTGGTGSNHTAEDVATLILANPTTPIANDGTTGAVTTTGGGGTVDTSALAAATMALNDAIANLGSGGTTEAYDDTELIALVTQVAEELARVKKVNEPIRHTLIARVQGVSNTTVESRVVETGE